MAHPFFKGMDFEKLTNREFEAPYRPKEEQMTLKTSEIHSSIDLKDIK